MEIFIMILLALSFFCIYVLIKFFEYLKKYHALKWKELSFESLFGISQEDFYFYPIRTFKFIPFLFIKDDINDNTVTTYKTVLKLSLLAIIFLLLICAVV